MERYALVFGANSFGALLLQTIITSVVVDSGALGLPIIPQVSNLITRYKHSDFGFTDFTDVLWWSCFLLQFIIYASYFSVISVVFLLRGIFSVCKAQRIKKEQSSLNGKQSEICEEHKF